MDRYQDEFSGWDETDIFACGSRGSGTERMGSMVERINNKFDDILVFLADGVLPEWQRIDSLETYFAKERQDYLKATQTGPQNPRTGRPMWNLGRGNKEDSWRWCIIMHSCFLGQRRPRIQKNAGTRFEKLMRKYAGSCGIITVWPKGWRGTAHKQSDAAVWLFWPGLQRRL